MALTKEHILRIRSLQELRQVDPSDVQGHALDEEVVAHVLRLCDAMWMHDGNPKRPHAQLTSGMCSNGFVNVLAAVRYTNVCTLLAKAAVHALNDWVRIQGVDPRIDWVVGSDHAGADFSHEVACLLNAQHDFTEKGPDKTQVWNRFPILPDEVVLQAEELITTSGTTLAVERGILKGHPGHAIRFFPLILTVVNRSWPRISHISDRQVLALLTLDIQSWKPEECPLCAQGSERFNPKPKANWARLTGQI